MRALNMNVASLCLAFGILTFGVLAGVGAASAEQKPGTKPPANPVGAGWDSKVKAAPGGTGQTFDAQQMAAIQKVSDYFNALILLQGRFVQTDPDKKVTKGKFYIKRPGRFRFEYARPSRKVIVSDGRFLAIQDLDLQNEETYELDDTPFRILLRKDVDILRDARILAVTKTDEQISVTLTENTPDAVGQISVVLKPNPKTSAWELAGWTTRDAQGLDTAVEVSDVSTPEKLDDALFKRANLAVKGMIPN